MPPRSPCDWPAARADLDQLEAATDPHAAAAAYVARYPKHPPDFFNFTSQTRRYRTRRAFADGSGWAARLVMSVETAAHFTLHAEHLDLDSSAAAPALLFDRGSIRKWKAAISTAFTGPHHACLEIGQGGRVHAHVLADLHDGPAALPRGGSLAKPCESYLEAVVGYLSKPPLQYTAEHLAIWLEGRAGGRRLPRLAWSRNVPNSRTLSNRSSLRTNFPIRPKSASTIAPQSPPPRRTFAISKPSRKTYVGELASRPLNTFCCEVGHPKERGPPPADQPTARTLDFCERNNDDQRNHRR